MVKSPHLKKNLTSLRQIVSIGTQPAIVRRSLKTSVVVGTILAMINHGDHLMAGTASTDVVAKVIITYAVPYTVSTWASIMALRSNI